MTAETDAAGPSLDVRALLRAYEDGSVRPEAILELVCERIEQTRAHNVWIHTTDRAAMNEALALAEKRKAAGEALPLFGIPFAVKDNIDVAGVPTTAACPAYARVPSVSAPVVQRLIDAGAICVGKTNLDQFATGLVGTRSPYGVCTSVFDDRYIAGGSSAGSALAVARDVVSFALGTDTAGSGRVPAAFNQLVGMKPTRGLVSTRGVVPACRSLDCVSFFTKTTRSARYVFEIAMGGDPADPYSRVLPPRAPRFFPEALRVGVPRRDQLEFFGDDQAEALYEAALDRLGRLHATRIEIDFAPFRDAAGLLYTGPWVAERYASVGEFIEGGAPKIDPVVRDTILGGRDVSGADVFRGIHRLEALKRSIEGIWREVDVLALPTTGTIYTVEAVVADPVTLNANLGFYTNFANLLDLAAIAIPAGLRDSGLPFGMSLVGPAFSDRALLDLAERFRARRPRGLRVEPAGSEDRILAVVGAHLTGLPLNSELTALGGRLVGTAITAHDYRLFALSGTKPERPGLQRVPGFRGTGIEVELWALDTHAFGEFLARVPRPLAIGTIELEDGTEVSGFVCEPWGLKGARDITHFGGWRRYLNAK